MQLSTGIHLQKIKPPFGSLLLAWAVSLFGQYIAQTETDVSWGGKTEDCTERGGFWRHSYGGYRKSCLTLSTLYLGNYSRVVHEGHAGLLVPTVGRPIVLCDFLHRRFKTLAGSLKGSNYPKPLTQNPEQRSKPIIPCSFVGPPQDRLEALS